MRKPLLLGAAVVLAGCADLLGLNGFKTLDLGAACGLTVPGWDCDTAAGHVCSKGVCVVDPNQGGSGGGGQGGGGAGGGGTGGACMDGAACYSGPAGTETVGNCQAGTQVCGAAPSCMGEVVPDPAGEDCYTTGDEDCDGHACSDLVWAKPFDALLVLRSIAVGGNGDVFVAGRASGTFTLSGDPVDELDAGAGAALVALFDAAGNHKWSQLPDTAQDPGDCELAAEPGGTYLAACRFDGPVTWFGQTFTPTNFSGTLFLRFDQAGTGQVLTYVDDLSGAGIAVAPDGTIVVAGTIATVPMNIGGVAIAAGTNEDAFVLALDASFVGQWMVRYGDVGAGMSPQRFRSVAVAPDGTIVAGGEFDEQVESKLGSNIASVGSQVFVVELDSTGVPSWEGWSEGADPKHMIRVAMDDAANALVLLDFAGSATLDTTFAFGLPVMTSSSMDDDFVLWKIAPNGLSAWVLPFGDDTHNADSDFTGQSLAVDGAGRSIIGSALIGTLDFGGGVSITAQGATDAFLAVVGPTGTVEWAKRYGDLAPFQVGYAVATTPSNDIVATFVNQGVMDFGAGPLMPGMAGGFQAILAKFQP